VKKTLIINTELQITHNKKYWLAENNFIKLKAKKLSDLEYKIETSLPNLFTNKKIKEIKEIKVHIFYDFSTFPKWLHQYHSHYFNRILIFKY